MWQYTYLYIVYSWYNTLQKAKKTQTRILEISSLHSHDLEHLWSPKTFMETIVYGWTRYQKNRKMSIFLVFSFPRLTQDCLVIIHFVAHVHGTIVLLISKVCYLKYWHILWSVAMHGTPFCYPMRNMRMLKKCCHGQMHATSNKVEPSLVPKPYPTGSRDETRTICDIDTSSLKISCHHGLRSASTSSILAFLMDVCMVACFWTLNCIGNLFARRQGYWWLTFVASFTYYPLQPSLHTPEIMSGQAHDFALLPPSIPFFHYASSVLK